MVILFNSVLLLIKIIVRYWTSRNPSSLMTLRRHPEEYHSSDRVFALKSGYVYPKSTAAEGVACEGYRNIKPFHAKWLWTPRSLPPTPQTLAITLSSYLMPESHTADSWFTVQIIDFNLFITTTIITLCVYV